MDFFESFLLPAIGILSTIVLPVGFGMYLGLSNIRARHKEKMELIKQGIVPPPATSPTPNKYRSLRNGFLCIGSGLGLITGLMITNFTSYFTGQNAFFLIAGLVLVCLGLAYVLFFKMTKNINLDE